MVINKIALAMILEIKKAQRISLRLFIKVGAEGGIPKVCISS
jgi:hypothetical protein